MERAADDGADYPCQRAAHEALCEMMHGWVTVVTQGAIIEGAGGRHNSQPIAQAEVLQSRVVIPPTIKWRPTIPRPRAETAPRRMIWSINLQMRMGFRN